jgi:hypothetical protein
MKKSNGFDRILGGGRRAATLVSVIAFVLAGCSPKASVSVSQEGRPAPLDHFRLQSDWAYYDVGKHDRYLISFPLPGAVAGDRHFYLYLMSTPGEGTRPVRGSLIGEPAAVVGFFVQQRGMNAGLADVVEGSVEIERVPLRKNRRRIHFVLECHDGSSLIGEAAVARSMLELREFEEQTHVADVERLNARALQPADTAPASE